MACRSAAPERCRRSRPVVRARHTSRVGRRRRLELRKVLVTEPDQIWHCQAPAAHELESTLKQPVPFHRSGALRIASRRSAHHGESPVHRGILSETSPILRDHALGKCSFDLRLADQAQPAGLSAPDLILVLTSEEWDHAHHVVQRRAFRASIRWHHSLSDSHPMVVQATSSSAPRLRCRASPQDAPKCVRLGAARAITLF